ncbi:MAG: hypothetical protein ACE5GO_02540 [Anaerolineales bacterium]
MRITRQLLLRIAKDTVAKRVRSNRNLLAVYLSGSLAGETDPIVGGAGDIDLVFVHEMRPPADREIVRLTEDVHLDIYHHDRAIYRQPRTLRTHPWLGQAIYGCQILHDPRHFLDFTQASVRAHFFHPDTVLQRSRAQIELARETWFSFQFYGRLGTIVDQPGRVEMTKYLRAVANVANAIANLNGSPLPERRFLPVFSSRAEDLGKPGLYPGLLGLLGAPAVEADDLRAWLPVWKSVYETAGELTERPIELHPYRYPYYRRAMDTLLESERPMDALWPLLNTWMEAVNCLPEGHDALETWQKVFLYLGLLGGGFTERIAALDAYLDLAEETLEGWAGTKGV